MLLPRLPFLNISPCASFHSALQVLITNRSKDRAEALAKVMGGDTQVVDWEAVRNGSVKADVLANSTSLGMAPRVSFCLRQHAVCCPTLIIDLCTFGFSD